MSTALENQKTLLVNHVSEKAAMIQNAGLRMRMSPVNQKVAKEAANLEKTKTLPQKHQKMILNFDATFAKASDVVAVVNLIATALENQKTRLMNHVSEKAAMIQNAGLRMRMSPVNQKVAKEAANLEKTRTLPRKHQKMTLNFDATFAKVSDVVAAVVIATALGNQKTPLLNPVSEKAAMIQNAIPRIRMLPVNQRVAKET